MKHILLFLCGLAAGGLTIRIATPPPQVSAAVRDIRTEPGPEIADRSAPPSAHSWQSGSSAVAAREADPRATEAEVAALSSVFDPTERRAALAESVWNGSGRNIANAAALSILCPLSDRSAVHRRLAAAAASLPADELQSQFVELVESSHKLDYSLLNPLAEALERRSPGALVALLKAPDLTIPPRTRTAMLAAATGFPASLDEIASLTRNTSGRISAIREILKKSPAGILIQDEQGNPDISFLARQLDLAGGKVTEPEVGGRSQHPGASGEAVERNP